MGIQQKPQKIAIHQPNLFPRPRTLRKLLLADHWVVLDDVQYSNREWQNRTKLQGLNRKAEPFWLTLPVSRINGRATLIKDVQVIDLLGFHRYLQKTIQRHYRASPDIDFLNAYLNATQPNKAMGFVDYIEHSTRTLFEMLGISLCVSRSSAYTVRTERSQRLADLCHLVGGEVYLCGIGGRRYLDVTPFDQLGIDVKYQTQHKRFANNHDRTERFDMSFLDWVARIGVSQFVGFLTE